MEFERQLSHAFPVAGKKRKRPPMDRVYVCGMGGSGAVGDALSAIQESRSPEIRTWKDYGLPKSENAGFIFSSFSGNTEETVSALSGALRDCPNRILGVATSGGKLKRMAEKAGLPRVIIPAGNLTPREALGYNVNASLTLLRSAFPSLRAPRVSLLSPSVLEARSGKLAGMIKGTIPLVYTEERDRVVGYAWKMHVNETGKTPCFINVLPEMGHNEIQSFENGKNPFTAVFLVRGNAPQRIMKRVRASMKILKKRNVRSVVVPLKGGNTAERMWNGILLGAWTGLSLVKAGKRDPKGTPAIAELKKKMVSGK